MIALLYIAFLYWYTMNQYELWIDQFSHKYRRSNHQSPSNARRPDTGIHVEDRWKALPNHLQRSSTYKGHVDKADENTDKDLDGVMADDDVNTENTCDRDSDYDIEEEEFNPDDKLRDVAGHVHFPVIAPRLKRRLETTSDKHRRGSAIPEFDVNIKGRSRRASSLGSTRSEMLNMDHVYMNFYDFMWCSFFVVPPMVFGALIGGPHSSGIFGLVKNRVLRKLGLKRQMEPQAKAEKALVEFCLNSSMATWITNVAKQDDGSVYGTITIPDASHITKLSTVNSGTLRLVIDMVKHRLIEASFQGGKIETHDCLALCFNAFGGHTHPLVHSFANWGINTNNNDNFVRRMALITIKYNNMGLESYPATMQSFRNLGLANYIDHDTTRLTCHMNHNVPSHAHLREVMHYSEYMRFIFCVRSRFLSEFQKCASEFPGIDGEALFVGTVIHSINHRQAPYYIDVANFTANNDRYVGDHEWAKATINCFVDKPPGRLFECRFSHADHRFFRTVYEYAVTIDPRLAGYMECCIAA